MKSSYLFVYGTLKRDIINSKHNLIAKYVKFIGYGFVYGKLYEVNNYPALILDKSAKSKVYGEIYKIKKPYFKKLFKILDDYEECSNRFKKPHEYKRVVANAYLRGRKIKVWLYEYNYKTDGLKLIKSGDYSLYLGTCRI